MKKLMALRQFLSNSVPWLAENPDKLLMFVESGHIDDTPRVESLSFQKYYTASIVVTDYPADLQDNVVMPLLAWLKKNQPQRRERKALDFCIKIIDNNNVDMEIKLELDEFVQVIDNGDGTVSTHYPGEPVYNGDRIATDQEEWMIHGGDKT
jgi:hypothetical protein